jgi:chromosome partitioning protein
MEDWPVKVIVAASQKGGSGKTTLVRSLAVAAEARHAPVVMLDTDPQGSLTSWYNRRAAETPQLAQLGSRSAKEALEQLQDAGAKLVLVDTPPSVHPFVQGLIEAADLVLVPVRPSPDDLGAIGPTLELIEAAGRPFAFVITQAKPRARLAAEALRVLAEHGRVAPAIIGDRADYPLAAVSGLVVTESAAGSKAALEVLDLLGFVERQISTKRVRNGK